MGEVGGVRGSEARRLLIMASVVVVIALVFVLSFARSCGIRDPYAGYVVIYNNLDLRDAANVVTQLKALKIPYQTRESGRSIAVPKDKADDARLGLAEKNLPTGGSVGWEIFDTSKLGTTDFDRRIQFIRALSGELSRTISRIDSVQDARIQIVIPETTLFEVTKVPVTASVLLQIKPGRKLTREQINGIVRLVANSVENLRPENVSIVDVFGNILSGPGAITPEAAAGSYQPLPMPAAKDVFESPKIKEAPAEVIMPKTVPTFEEKTAMGTKEIEVVPAEQIVPKTPEEKALSKIKTKEELENRLSSKAQTIVNRFYPPNSILVKVNLEMDDYKVSAKKVPGKSAKKIQPKKKKVNGAIRDNIKKMTVIVLVDNRFNLTPQLKKTTLDMIASSLSYHPSRGDKIVLRQVPFHYATATKAGMMSKGREEQQEFGKPDTLRSLMEFFSKNKSLVFWGIGIFAVIVVMRRLLNSRKRPKVDIKPSVKKPEQNTSQQKNSSVDQIRSAVARSPEKVAKLLEKWISEEEGGGQ